MTEIERKSERENVCVYVWQMGEVGARNREKLSPQSSLLSSRMPVALDKEQERERERDSESETKMLTNKETLTEKETVVAATIRQTE